MQIAIAVGTLLLGGWVLDTPEETNEPAVPEQAAPSVTPPAGVTPAVTPPVTPSMGVSEYQGLQGVRAMQHGRSLGRAPGESVETLRGHLKGNQAVMAGRGGQPLSRMPLAPTEALPPGAETTLGQPAIPTAPTNTLGMPTNVSGGGARAQGLDLAAPTERAPAMLGPQGGYRATSYGLDQSRMVQSTVNPNVIAPPVQASTAKPFAGYQTPSGQSPYMNLFRNGTDNGTIDNYTTLVRPQLNQRFLNQQFGQDIRGLQSDTRLQGQSLMNQSRQLQGVSTPQFYMNYGGYYSFPGGGQGP
jgi:hypothetical protein